MSVKILLILIIVFLSFFGNLVAQDVPGKFKMLESYLISGLIPDIEDGYGVAFRDFTNDGYPDIYLVCFRNLNRLLINNGGIIPFIDRTIYSGMGGYLMPRGETNLELGASAADYDNDGKPDIFLAGWGKTHKLFHNLGDLVFEDATSNLNLQGVVDANYGIWFDADNDGYLDLYLTDEHHSNRFFLNNKNGFFSEAIWTESFIDTAVSQGGCASDFDSDGDLDLYICNWFSADYLLLNNGEGIFSKANLNLPTLNNSYRSNSASTADIDNDGDLDLYVSTKEGIAYLYRNESINQSIVFELDSTNSFNFGREDVYGALLQDFNHDGWVDCFFSLFGENKLFLNDGQGGFDKNFDSDKRRASSTGSAVADLDFDGDLDIFVANKKAFGRVYLNPTNDDNFIFLKLTGVVSNRDAIGSKIYYYDHEDTSKSLIGFREISAQSGYLSSSDPSVHFGTGGHRLIDVRIEFPSGKRLERSGLIPGERYVFAEYNLVISKILFSLNSIRYQISRTEFWLNFGLLFVFILIIWVHINLSLNRYQWQAVGMATQLIIWLVVSLIIFMIFLETELYTILIALNSVSLVGALIVTGYSEHMRSLREKRKTFRNQLQKFSEQMINLHDNKQLYDNLIKTITQHEDIKNSILIINQDNKLCLYKSKQKIPSDCYSLSTKDIENLLRQNIIDFDTDQILSALFKELSVNIFLPVKRETELFGLIGIKMINRRSPLNQEDIQILQTIANQTAIAIENNNYIEESARLVKQLTESQVREEYLKQLENTNKELDQKNAELTKLFKELQEKEAQLVHSEKMASLGQLVAGISHELNNPISFIYANSQTLKDYLSEVEDLWGTLDKNLTKERNNNFKKIVTELNSIITDNINGSRSVKDLVINLKNFSRLDQAEWKEAQIVSGIESSIKLLKSQITENIELATDFKFDPIIYCNPGQLNQVMINLISNAIQAINGQGKIFIRTFEDEKNLNIEVEDTGVGIAKNDITKIFDPFFTTKDVNVGTGLGLSISYSIVQNHNGFLKVKSELGKGSVFSIILPLQNSKHKN